MKNLKITLLLLFISVASFAQSGMVFQGIARDNNSAAITDKTMTFIFRITRSDGSELFKETQQIRTDNFGVFSHIIGTGTPVNGSFAAVDFQEANLKAIINVNNDGVDTQIYDQPFQYVPYAKHAQNGVPVGTVIAFMGDLNQIPDGWVLCDGRRIQEPKYAALRARLGNGDILPDLRGRFIKGAGISDNIPGDQYDAVNLSRQYQNQSIMKHRHDHGDLKTDTQGAHKHGLIFDTSSGGYVPNGELGRITAFRKENIDLTGHSSSFFSDRGGHSSNHITNSEGSHWHNVNSGHTGFAGNKENRPWSYTVWYIIKY